MFFLTKKASPSTASKTAAPQRRPTPLYKKLAISVVTLIVLTILTEVALRLIDPQPMNLVYNARQVYCYTNWQRADLRPNRQATLVQTRTDGTDLLRFTMSTNELGMRNQGPTDRLVSPKSQTARTVVHCIGDSLTMGWGVDDDQTYPAFLSRSLDDSHLVLNVGMQGYGILAAAEKSRRIAEIYQPNVVLYVFCPNDFDDDPHTQVVQSRSSAHHAMWYGIDFAREYTYVANIPWALQVAFGTREARSRPAPVFDNSELKPTQAKRDEILQSAAAMAPIHNFTTEALVKLAEQYRQSQTRFVVIVTLWNQESLGIVRCCLDHSIEMVLFPMVDDRLSIPDDGHFSVEGNRLLAEYLCQEVFRTKPQSQNGK